MVAGHRVQLVRIGNTAESLRIEYALTNPGNPLIDKLLQRHLPSQAGKIAGISLLSESKLNAKDKRHPFLGARTARGLFLAEFIFALPVFLFNVEMEVSKR